MKAVCFISFFLVVSLGSFAQQDTIKTSDPNYFEKNLSGKNNVHIVFINKTNDRKVCEGDYLNNEKNSLWIVYNDDGTISRQQSFKNGKKDGVWLVYSKKTIERKEQFLDGKLTSGHTYNSSGEEIPYFQEPVSFADKIPTPTFDVNKYLRKNLHYPASSKLAGIEGTVLVKFTVKADGTISNPIIVKGLDDACNEEAKRLIIEMKPWTPGVLGGENVSVYYTMSLSFK